MLIESTARWKLASAFYEIKYVTNKKFRVETTGFKEEYKNYVFLQEPSKVVALLLELHKVEIPFIKPFPESTCLNSRKVK